ncbi:MAG: FKBP-type peptidyl-prolyl cis-trans isomerase [Bacteroidales bacterium]|jgi:FKBP-type peptidyl-prolyl cis-trans isomerase SlyD|nr:FKBP-type peptidyl-prolyl cis-trans isomerase [Bacteroidales bacterium]MDD4086262.1 FKBP-type peptidyl-prolyl cis-trans isomerase [Bacteroidales bacterium]MDY0085111.1 FKBP-type peptidyl-prolyl cis-trans isomerase [Bacteroidales bacterium]
MVIEAQKVGILSYQIKVNNDSGEVLEEATIDNPRTMLFGTGRVMQSFESRLYGLKSGDSFDFVIEPEEAFGNFKEELVMDIPISAFVVKGELKSDKLKVGNTVPMMDSEGNPFDGRVIAIDDQTVKMDFNHPLAGKALHTLGQVLNVREATYEELNPAPSGCGCGSHSDSCCGGGHSHEHHHEQETESCGVCGSADEYQTQGVGSCQCH